MENRKKKKKGIDHGIIGDRKVWFVKRELKMCSASRRRMVRPIVVFERGETRLRHCRRALGQLVGRQQATRNLIRDKDRRQDPSGTKATAERNEDYGQHVYAMTAERGERGQIPQKQAHYRDGYSAKDKPVSKEW